MEVGRRMIYFSNYRDGVKMGRAGYAGICVKGTGCRILIYYKGEPGEEGKCIKPVYQFRDGSRIEGEELPVSEGMASAEYETSVGNFLNSGKEAERLESIYIEGTSYICGGRLDGQELPMEDTYSVLDWMDTVTEVVAEEWQQSEVETIPEPLPISFETWSLPECMDRLPVMKLPYDGVRRRCCRMSLEDLEHFPKEWKKIKENHFLLHGYYEYHHLLLAKLCTRYGERYALGVPGEYCYRNQYMAESFGFPEFAPLEPGKRQRGSFGYWYLYLTTK